VEIAAAEARAAGMWRGNGGAQVGTLETTKYPVEYVEKAVLMDSRASALIDPRSQSGRAIPGWGLGRGRARRLTLPVTVAPLRLP
jgi:hypothetical protein